MLPPEIIKARLADASLRNRQQAPSLAALIDDTLAYILLLEKNAVAPPIKPKPHEPLPISTPGKLNRKLSDALEFVRLNNGKATHYEVAEFFKVHPSTGSNWLCNLERLGMLIYDGETVKSKSSTRFTTRVLKIPT